MINVTFTQRDGVRKTCQAQEGMTMLELAHENDIDIEGTCGGSMACATCHLHIQPEWLDKLPPPSEEELDMLELASDRNERSRLGCQIVLNPELDGFSVALPEKDF